MNYIKIDRLFISAIAVLSLLWSASSVAQETPAKLDGAVVVTAAGKRGDGAILVLHKDQSTRRIGEADSGQFSGEVSCFVPDDNARDKAKKIDFIAPADAIECVLLCTDGIEDPFFPIAKKAGDLFRQLYAGVSEPLKDFKAQPMQPRRQRLAQCCRRAPPERPRVDARPPECHRPRCSPSR